LLTFPLFKFVPGEHVQGDRVFRLYRFGLQWYETEHNAELLLEPYGAAAIKLRIPVPDRPNRLPRGEGVGGGQLGRVAQLRRSLQTLFDEERLELRWKDATEVRLYAERLIQEAIRSSYEPGTEELVQFWLDTEPGKTVPLDDLTVQTSCAVLELVVFWLTKPHLVEKLFKVFVPRYRFYDRAYTSLFRLPPAQHPSPHAQSFHGFGVLELHGNPWPPVRGPVSEPFKDRYLVNILVAGALKHARAQQNSSSEPNKAQTVSMDSTSPAEIENS
uniref:Large ribosomal subunit protein bL17m n=1 Tax=Echinostoma caproni TaxID=27848 RepID=A0A183AIA6_9TREM